MVADKMSYLEEQNSKISGQFLYSNSNVITDKLKISNMFNSLFSDVGINLAKNITPSKHHPEYNLPRQLYKQYIHDTGDRDWS